MAVSFDTGIFSVIGINSELLIGAKLYWFVTGTSTPLATYSDPDLTTPNTNPVLANGSGRFPPIWLQDAEYKMILTAATGDPSSPLVTRDPVDGTTLVGPDGAGKVGFSQSQTYPAATVGSHLKHFISVTDAPFNAKGDGSTDDTAAIKAAITFAAATMATLYFPAGTYKIIPATNLTAEGGTVYKIAFPILSDMHILADEGASTRVANNVSTDGAPLPMALFATDQVVSNISITGLTMDMNGQNNKISPNRGSGVYSRDAQAQFMVTSTPAGVAARASNVTFTDCVFLNCPGTNCIIMGQSNTASTILGENVNYYNCRFLDNGLDTDDHSTIYGWNNKTAMVGCTFDQSQPFGHGGTLVGGNCAYEIHGSNHRLIGNYFGPYLRGVYIASNYTSAVVSSIVADNTFACVFHGVDTYLESASASSITDAVIADNVFQFDDTAVTASPGENLKTCVGVLSAYGVQRFTITGNRVMKTGAAIGSLFCTVGGSASGSVRHDEIVCENNQGHGLTFGTLTRTSATVGLGTIFCRANHWKNLTPTTDFPLAAGDAVKFTTTPQPFAQLGLGGGSCIDDRGTPLCAYGITLDGVDVTTLSMEQSTFVGMVNANYSESGSTITNRQGKFDRLPLTLEFKGGSTDFSGGTQSSYMTIDGSDVKVVGSIILAGAPPAGTITAVFPIPVAPGGQGQGTWSIRDVSASTYYGGVSSAPASAAFVQFEVAGANLVTDTAPVTLAAGDILTFSIDYQR